MLVGVSSATLQGLPRLHPRELTPLNRTSTSSGLRCSSFPQAITGFGGHGTRWALSGDLEDQLPSACHGHRPAGGHRSPAALGDWEDL